MLRTRFYSLLAALALFGISAYGQLTTGQISGTVKDSSDAPVPNLKVVVTSQETGIDRETSSGPEGYYVILDLPPGTYQVHIAQPGFKAGRYAVPR